MTEAELLGISQMGWANFVTAFGVAITVISGYLIAAYVVGASLTRSQASIINALYIGCQVSVLAGLHAFRTTTEDIETIAWTMTTQRTFAPTPWIAWGVLVFVALSTLASLKFMWDVRHPKTE